MTRAAAPAARQIALGEPVVISGTKYRVRRIDRNQDGDYRLEVSRTPARIARFLARGKTLDFDRRAGVWRFVGRASIVALVRITGVCRVCRCVDERACDEGCYWIEPDLCSACATRDDIARAEAPR